MANTRLIAVNQMLDSIGETRVNSIDDTVGDSKLAAQILDEKNTEIQDEGWFGNTLLNHELTVDTNSKELVVPLNALQLEQRAGNRQLVLIKGRALDRVANTFKFENSVFADVIIERDFDELPHALRVYITKVAARAFHRATLGSQKVEGFTEKDVLEARKRAGTDNTKTQTKYACRQTETW